MSLKNKNLGKTSADVVKSQLASAYEDGVTGFGDKPPTTQILEKQYSFEVNSIEPFAAVAHKSAEIQSSLTNKIASIQIEKTEIDSIKDRLDAAFIEDILDDAIITRILTTIKDGPDDALREQLERVHEKVIKELEEANASIDAAAAIFHAIELYSLTLAKGNLLDGTARHIRKMSNVHLKVHLASRSVRCVDPFILNHGSLSESIDGYKQITPNIIEKMARCLNGSNPSFLKDKSITTLVTQMMAMTEDALDYGVSERFFLRALNSAEPWPIFDPDSWYTGTAKYGMRQARVREFGSEASDKPITLGNIFSKGATGHSGPNSSLIVVPPKPTSSGRGNNPTDCIPEFLNVLSTKDKLIYLSSLVTRELLISRGISSATVTSSPDFENILLPGMEQRSGPSVTDHLYGPQESTNIPLCRQNAFSGGASQFPIGKRLFGPSSQIIELGEPTNSAEVCWNEAQSDMSNLVVRKIPGSSTATDPTFLPLEVLPQNDPDTFDHIGNSATLKSQVSVRLESGELNQVKEALEFHKHYLDQLKTTSNAVNTALWRMNNIDHGFTLETPLSREGSIAAGLTKRVFSQIGKMIKNASMTNHATHNNSSDMNFDAKQSFYDLVALTSFFKPNTKANEHHRFLKADFLRRIAVADLMDNVLLEGEISTDTMPTFKFPKSETSTALMTNGFGYSKDLEGWFNKSLLTLRQNAGEKTVYNFSPSYLEFLDPVDTEKYSRGYVYIIPGNPPPPEMVLAKSLGQHFYDAAHKNSYVSSVGSWFLGGTGSTNDADIAKKYFEAGSPLFGQKYGLVGVGTELGNLEYGFAKKVSGHDFVETVWGPGSWSQWQNGNCLMKRILDLVKEIEDEMFLGANSVKPPFQNGASVGNGADKGQIMAIVLEMMSIVADDLLESVFTASPLSIYHNEERGEQNPFSFFQKDTPDFTDDTSVYYANSLYPHAQGHIIGLSPKINDFWSTSGRVMADSSKHINFKNFGQFVSSLGKPTHGITNLKSSNFASFAQSVLDNAFSSMEEKQGYADKVGKGIYGGLLDYNIGKNLSLRTVQEILRECSEEDSFIPICSSGITDMFDYIEQVYNWDPLDYSGGDDAGMVKTIAESLSSKRLDNFTFKEFIKSASLSQVYQSKSRHHKLSRSFKPYVQNATGIDPVLASSYLKDAAILFLEKASGETENNFVEFTFFGLTNKIHKNEILKKIAKDADISSMDQKSIVYNFDFIKASELDTEVKFQRSAEDLPTIQFDLGIIATLEGIHKPMANNSPPTSFSDLVRKIAYQRVKYQNEKLTIQDLETITGNDLIEESDDPLEMEAKLEKIVESQLMSFIFERLTGFPVFSYNLVKVNNKVIEESILRMFLEGLKMSRTDLFNFDTSEVINALFDTNPVTKDAGTGTFLRFTESEEKIKKALEPQLDREGAIAKFKEPIVNSDLLMAIQAILKTNYIAPSSLSEITLGSTLFDNVLAINTTKTHRGNAFKTTPDPAALGSDILKDKLNQVKQGEFKIDTVRAVVSREVIKL